MAFPLKYLCNRLYFKISLLEFPSNKTFTPIFLARDLANVTCQQTTFCYEIDPRQTRVHALSFTNSLLTKNRACEKHAISGISHCEKYETVVRKLRS
jgi:hypothetical protein